jgi:Protein of unknown function (DUF3341)
MSAGLLAEFADAFSLQRAAKQMRDARIGAVETHAPLPTDDSAASLLPLAILIAGVLVAAAVFALQWYATVRSYPINVGGRSTFSWPAFVPMAFEFGVLGAVATGFFGFLIACRLPALYDPIDEIDGFRRASRDGFFLAVRVGDAAAVDRARSMLRELGPVLLADLPR